MNERFWTDERILKAVALSREGFSARQIGEMFGCEKSGVCKKLKQYREKGLPMKRITWTRRPVKDLSLDRGLKTYRMSQAEIERNYGRPGEQAEKVPLMVYMAWKTEAAEWGMEARI